MSHLSVASLWINALIRSFAQRGLDIEALVSDLPGFEGGQFSTNARIDLLTVRRLWHRADQQAQDPLLGARIGTGHAVRSLGVLSPLVWHSPNLAIAMQHAAKYQSLISENGAFRYEEADDGYHLRCVYEETPSILPSHSQQLLSIVSTVIVTMIELGAPQRVVDRVVVPENLPHAAIGAMLGIDTRSEGAVFSFDIDPQAFEEPIPDRDEVLYRLCLDYANGLMAAREQGDELLDGIKRYVVHHGYANAAIERYAEQQSASVRYLQRQLAAQGTSFRLLKEEVLKEAAIADLAEGRPVSEIATRLGYSEPSAFYRAFKSWFGAAPREVAQRYRGALGR